MPVDCAVFEVGDLRRERWIDVESVVWGEAETEVAEHCDLVGATVAGQEGIRWMRTPVCGVVVDELFGELEPWLSGVRLLGILLVGVGRAAGFFNGTGNDAEDSVGHSWPVRRLLAGIEFEIVEGVLGRVILLKVQRECIEDDIGLFDKDATVHSSVLFDDTRLGVAGNEDVVRNVCKSIIQGHTKHFSKHIGIGKGVRYQCHGETAIIFHVGVLVRVGHVQQSIRGPVLGDDLRVKCRDGVVDWKQRFLEKLGISRRDPIIGKLLRYVTVDVIFIV